MLLWIHIPFGTLSLVLFWIPVGVKKGSPLHRKVGWYYYISMWVVLISALLLCVTNVAMSNYYTALFLGYLVIITSHPLWYSYEILRQTTDWTARYFLIRRIFLSVTFIAGIILITIGTIVFQLKEMGIIMVFFGLLAVPSIKELRLSKASATQKETRLKMHIQGTIITGIAAYTAFFAFGGRRIFIDVFHLDPQWMIVPWIAPTLLGLIYANYMKKKYHAI